MGLKRIVSGAFARLTGERAAAPPPNDPAFHALCLNLSHILRLPIAHPRVQQAATVSWRNRHRECDLSLTSVWPADIFQQFQTRASLLVMPPAGCNFCPTCLGDGITGYLLSPDPSAPARDFFGSPAHIWLEPIVSAYANQRPMWFGWFAAPPRGRKGELVDVFNPRAPVSLDDVIAEILRRSEAALRAVPGQCLTDGPFWPAPYAEN